MTKRYSLRKLQIGKLVLALVGSFIAVGASSTQQLTIYAQEQVQEQKVQLHYLSESDLTPEQKQALVQLDSRQTVEQGDAVYHYVFRPQVAANQLPSTGASDNLIGILAGASLIVLAVAVSKSKKSRRIVSMTLFTLGAGGILSSTAIAQEVFANLVEEVTVQVGEAIPTPKAIEGYEFTGYYVREKATAQPELPVEVAEPTTAEQPTAPVQPVTPEPEQPTTPAQPVTPEPGQPPTPVQPVIPVVPNPVEPSTPVTPDPVQPVSETGDANTEEVLPEAVVNSQEVMEEVPFKEIVKEDADLEVGTVKVIQEGENGYVKKRLDTITVNNIKVDTHIEILETKEAKDKIIVRGTKVVTPVVPVTPDPVQPVSEKGDANKEDALPEAVVNSEEVTEEINFNEVTREDDQLEEGTVKAIQEGEKGYTKKRIDTITVDGKVVDQREVIVETKEAKDKITVKGTKKVEPVTPEQPTTDGHVIKLSKYLDPSGMQPTPTWEYVNSLPNSEKIKLQFFTADYKEDPEARKEVVKLSRELFNYKAFNESFLKLINAERATKGANPLQLDENLIYGAQIRASEQADIAQSLRTDGKKHVRPDGSNWSTITTDINKINPNWSSERLGENALETGEFVTDVAKILNYDLVAKNMFEQWKSSSGHYENMMSSSYTHIGLGVAHTLYSKTKSYEERGKVSTVVGITLFGTPN